MRMDVREALKNPGQSYPVSAAIELPAMDVLDETICFDGIRIEGELIGAGESVRVDGTITAEVRAHCAKCLTPVKQGIEASVSEIFAKEMNPDDPDQYPLDGYAVELTDLVRDALLLELPMRFLCGEGCKGLCPSCGQDLNKQRCTCQEGEHGPFSALSGLLKDDEEV